MEYDGDREYWIAILNHGLLAVGEGLVNSRVSIKIICFENTTPFTLAVEVYSHCHLSP